jgi:hypothetical protein
MLMPRVTEIPRTTSGQTPPISSSAAEGRPAAGTRRPLARSQRDLVLQSLARRAPSGAE